jgi:hypothetical protein
LKKPTNTVWYEAFEASVWGSGSWLRDSEIQGNCRSFRKEETDLGKRKKIWSITVVNDRWNDVYSFVDTVEAITSFRWTDDQACQKYYLYR